HLPDDAAFCNRCGRLQKSETNTQTSGNVMLPSQPVPNIPLEGGQPSSGNVFVIQNTPSAPSSPFTKQDTSHSALLSSVVPQSLPSDSKPIIESAPHLDASPPNTPT